MKKQQPKPDIFILPLIGNGPNLAAALIARMQELGRPIVRKEVEIAGIKVDQIEVHGKRPGEGVIAADVKARKHENG